MSAAPALFAVHAECIAIAVQRRLGRRIADAVQRDDVVQEAMLRVCRALAAGEVRADGLPQLVRFAQVAARNVCTDMQRRQQRNPVRTATELGARLEDRPAAAADHAGDFAGQQDTAAFYRQLRELLVGCDPLGWNVALAHVCDGERFPVIARRHGMKTDAVRKMWQRLRERAARLIPPAALRRALEGLHDR
ncbi:MAG TPA: sigma-70 family RNA polymerase sigma factor [Planctomycetota bacterium]|nr:sigma-70 family RNA polymerase sigma factor [Planctomycetota bacterium]